MAEDESPGVKLLEAHEELASRIESSSGRMRTLSVITVLVAGFLAISYVSQLALPYLTGDSSVTVNLRDPANELVELVVLALALVWLWVGVRDYAFSSRLSKSIRESRVKEREIEKRITE